MGKILYILSVGHSGSTLLDFTLGQFENVFSTGELKHLTWQLYREVNGIKDAQGKCTCGKEFRDCNIWSNILRNISKDIGCDIENLSSKFILKHFDKLSFFEDQIILKILRKYYKVFLKYKFLSNIMSLFFKKINTNNKILYTNIFKITKTDYIVDSSKDIIRFNELRKKNDVFPIILIRDVENIYNSKYVQGNIERVKDNWLNYYNKNVKNLINNMNVNDYHIISFDKFLDDPEKEIEKLSLKLNIRIKGFKTHYFSENYHFVAGNPMRYKREIEIQKKELNPNTLKSNLEKSGLDEFFIRNIISFS